MRLACETCGRSYVAEPQFDGVQLFPSPDALTQLLMQADRVVATEFDTLVRRIATVLAGRGSHPVAAAGGFEPSAKGI
jgi:hypothetical protein